MSVSFKVTQEETDLILRIARRAVREARKAKIRYPLTGVRMDLTATHANGCVLRLADLLKADTFNFNHDIFGIRKHLNRKTGQVEQFWPRYAVEQ